MEMKILLLGASLVTSLPTMAGGKPISPNLFGIFFEDLNYAADGGLYAELVQNRSFEYSPSDVDVHKQPAGGWHPFTAWEFAKEGNGIGTISLETREPIHPNNPHYLLVDVKTVGKHGVGIRNKGYDGIVLRKEETYRFSVFLRNPDGGSMPVDVVVKDHKGTVVADTSFTASSSTWKQYEMVLRSRSDADTAALSLLFKKRGTVAVDMVSLFPIDTYKGRKNGLRRDIAETIAALKPAFVRFPGGCLAHGDGLDNIYQWKNTIGPVEQRKGDKNIWNYHQSMGLGYFEYFQFCEDIGAKPLPVIAAGVSCQNSARRRGDGQECVPMEDMLQYIQDILDLVEYCNGPSTSEWGSKRAAAGHPEPFNLKYVGIGNEDLITPVFEERFEMIFKAVKEKYPEITVIGTVGPFYEGTDYEAGWKFATRLNVPMVDEHYYNTPGWFINNQDYYDRYDRAKPKVYLGEYAAHLPGRPNNIETALAEALYLTSVERNGDIVSMTSYAPLLAKEGHTQWNPDLIYFNNREVKPTVGYYTQLLYGQNSGDSYLPADRKIDNPRQDVQKRIGTSVVRDSKTGDWIVKLVNLLPVPVKAKVEGLTPVENGKVVLQVLSGKPTDKNARPVKKEITMAELSQYEMPAYSLNVIRVKVAGTKK